jgi:hypothetical protein
MVATAMPDRLFVSERGVVHMAGEKDGIVDLTRDKKLAIAEVARR